MFFNFSVSRHLQATILLSVMSIQNNGKDQVGFGRELWHACDKGVVSFDDLHAISVKSEIALGADVNYSHEGRSCLHVAVSKGFTEIVVLLLNTGANTEAKAQNTPLIMAVTTGHYELVKLLLNAFADTKSENFEGATALMVAADRGHYKCIKLLVNAGADLEAKNSAGFTALIGAATNGHEKCVSLLVNFGADKEAIGDGKPALFHAAIGGHSRTVKELFLNGADINAVDANYAFDSMECRALVQAAREKAVTEAGGNKKKKTQ
jgi:ankyrin repeat protein